MNGTTCFNSVIINPPPMKVLLFPEEGWARTASNSHLLLKTPWWSSRYCHVLTVEGTKRTKTMGRMVCYGSGDLFVEGTFRDEPDGDFRLILSPNLSMADERRGYQMIGSLERGDRRSDVWQTTHFAVTKNQSIP
ncbi:unnamed protein product [Meganyctiphanes norvegica]|uniref:Uncharacterized protein n=1 Tax=Meganyctiphanes norvegica TaxID=48144 RepID=A0AAV2S276_MEGNR